MNDPLSDFKVRIALRDHFSGMITERRWNLFREVAQSRTKYLTLVLEDIFQSHNASAVLRSCDCFGIQDVHLIENQYTYEVNPEVAMGSSQWLTLKRFSGSGSNTAACIEHLKSRGYRIVTTLPSGDATPIHEFDVTAGRFALLFGTEKEGLSEEAIRLADEHVKIPMHGFTESFNISVSAALCMFHFTERIRKEIDGWHLNENEVVDVHLDWFRNTVREARLIEERFLSAYHS